MSKEIDWREYERRKAELQPQNLSPEEYERAIIEILRDLEG